MLIILIGAQAALTLFSFRSLQDLTNPRPLLNVDFCSQYYWAQAAREFRKASGRLWGYDPHFMAGYPLDFIENSSLPVQLVSVALSAFNPAGLIKACFVVSFVLLPLTLYFSLRKFGLSLGPALAGCAMGIISFWIAENALFGRWGMISGAFLLHFFLVPLSLLFRFLKDKKTLDLLLLFIFVPLAFLIHKTAFVLLLPPAVLWSVFFRRSLSRRDGAKLAAVLVFALLVNLFWLLPFMRFLPLKVEDPATTYFQNLELCRWLTDLLPFQTFFGLPLFRLALVVLGVMGLRKMRREGDVFFIPLLLALGFLGILSYFGSFLPPLRHLQPYRYITAYFYFWLPPAAGALHGIYRRLPDRPAFRIGGPPLLAAVLAGFLFLPSFHTFSRVAPLSTDLDRDSLNFIAWAKQNTDGGARIMMEDINAWEDKPIYGGARLPHLFPLLVRRELIGGPLTNAFLVHHYATFQDGRLLDRSILEYSDQALAEVLDRYNVGWIVCWSEFSKSRLRTHPALDLVSDFGGLWVFVVRRRHGFFLEGKGEISAGFDRLELSGLTTSTGRVVVSYHWVDGLVSDPPAELVRVPWGDDPAGFIGIVHPPSRLVIRLGP